MVPEDKDNDSYEEKKKIRLIEMENLCDKGPSNFCRAPSVWKGNKEKEDKDRKWAEEKLKLLRAERTALKEGKPSEAKKMNFKLKMHEKTRPAPEKKRELERTGNSPNQSKIPKTTGIGGKAQVAVVGEHFLPGQKKVKFYPPINK